MGECGVYVRLLGSVSVKIGERELSAFRTRKTAARLAYLALDGRNLARRSSIYFGRKATSEPGGTRFESPLARCGRSKSFRSWRSAIRSGSQPKASRPTRRFLNARPVKR